MHFPYGKAALAILLIAVAAGLLRLWTGGGSFPATKPVLVCATGARTHYEAYLRSLPAFREKHGVNVEVELVSGKALGSRLQSALLVNAPVPELVEIAAGELGLFTRGPMSDIGLVDLTDRMKADGLMERLVTSRLAIWSREGHVFALPHDVHPVMLAYRRDLVEQLGIDVDSLRTWDDFVRVGQRVTADTNRDGTIDRYMIDLPLTGGSVQLLLLQRGCGMFDEHQEVAFDKETVADVFVWYIHQTRGPKRIGFEAGWGQNLSRNMTDGVVLFYFCPDWRTKMFMMDMPHLSGKLALMPLPAWEPGGIRTTTWGGVGLAITRQCKDPDLAWQFARHLYLDKAALGQRFKETKIIPPLKEAWDLPEFKEPEPYFGNQPIGSLLAALAPEAPAEYVGPFMALARAKMIEAFLNTAQRFEAPGRGACSAT